MAQYQILNVDAMSKYKPTDYTRDTQGNVMLNAGVAPIAGTYKEISANPNVIKTSALVDKPETISAINTAKSQKELGLDAVYSRTLAGTATDIERKKLDYAVNAGIWKSPEQKAKDAADMAKSQAELAKINAETESIKSAADTQRPSNAVTGAYDELIKTKESQLGPTINLDQYKQASNEASIDLEKARQAVSNKNILDAVTLKQFENKIIPMSAILGQKSQYESAQAIPNLMLTQEYNDKLILQKMAAGQLLEAQILAKENANDAYEIQKLQIERAKEENRITENEQARLDVQAQAEKDLALDGFVKITGPSGLKGLTEDQIVRVPNPITGGVDIYKKPEGSGETQVVTADGMVKLIDTSNGKTIATIGTAETAGVGDITPNARASMIKEYEDSGLSPEEAERRVDQIAGGSTPTTATAGARTDRHNNPTAMTTDVAKTLGLIEGVDYVKGDQFPEDSTLFTAKLLGDPIETTIKALDTAANDPNKQAFYTQGGAQRWTYTAMSDNEWKNMSPGAKRDQIALMYRNEGGDGSLLGANVDKYSDEVKRAGARVASGETDIDDSSIKEIRQNVLNYMNDYGIKIPLSQARIKQLETSSGGKILLATQPVISTIESLKDLVEKHGTEWYNPTVKGKMRSLWSELITGWKEQKNLGAITGPDLDLAMKAIPDPTNVFQRNETVLSAINTALNMSVKNNIIGLNNMSSKGENIKDSEYFNQLQNAAGISDSLIEQNKKELSVNEKNGDRLGYDPENGEYVKLTGPDVNNTKYITINF